MLRAIEEDGLQANSARVGGHLMCALHGLKAKHDIIGDVRGKGLMVGIELVKDRTTKVRKYHHLHHLFLPPSFLLFR